VKAEGTQKEKYAKGTVQEDAHKKETISKEISKKKTAYTKGKQKSLSDEKKNKASTRKAEIKVKDCEKKKIKENAKKLADEHTIKGLKEKLSKKVKYGKEKEGKIYSKWHKHMSVEKGEKKSEVSLKGNKEKKKKADSSLEGKRKLSKELARKSGKAKKATEKNTKEGAKKVKAEGTQKEKYAKGTVQEDAHKKEKLTKVSMAKVAYSESKGKKSCIETRKSSETNNKLVITYFNNGVKNLEKNCAGLKGVRKKDQTRFVEKVCEGVHRDVQASIDKVTKAMKKVGKQSFTFHTKGGA